MTRFFQEEFIKGRALLLLSPQSHSVHTGAKFILCTYLRYLLLIVEGGVISEGISIFVPT